MNVVKDVEVKCFHCNEPCLTTVKLDDKSFCCAGCKAVYELFLDADLAEIYAETNRLRPTTTAIYDYLDNEQIAKSLLDFQSENHNSFSVSLPAIHCSSCIYLLENLNLLEAGIIKSNVNFGKREAQIHYNPQLISLKQISALLDRIGYKPQFNKEVKTSIKSNLGLKIGVAAFCFGNIMMLSFPEYLGIDDFDSNFKIFFAYLNILLALPVLFYSAHGYFVSAYKGLKSKFINIDVPIALGIITLFGRSVFEIMSQSGGGYLDSMAGLVFFLLIGKWFQNKTYENLSFERDYKSYFPLAATVVSGGSTKSVPISDLVAGDEILIRNQEIIPADGILISDRASIDYSFVTGEIQPITKKCNEQIFAGGRQVGASIKLRVERPSSQSYLTSLWNNQVFNKAAKPELEGFTNRISKYFTLTILFIALLAAVAWYFIDTTQIWQVATAVLIVACPCALALSAPFTNGNIVRVFGRNKMYLRNASAVEKFNGIDTIVFDKTGTLTHSKSGNIHFVGDELSAYEKGLVYSLTQNSMHPLSRRIHEHLKSFELVSVDSFEEIPGKGLTGVVDGQSMKLGQAAFLDTEQVSTQSVYLSINGVIRGHYKFEDTFRAGLKDLTAALSNYKLAILSGDNDSEKDELKRLFPDSTTILFEQTPQDKLDFIKELQQEGHAVLMLGDGLNDAGALKQSDVGIAITEDVATFSPACDGILEGNQLTYLADYLSFAKKGRSIVITSFVISLLYNVVGLGFAVSGMLTPIFAAILMPVSSISVVGFTTLASNLVARNKHLI